MYARGTIVGLTRGSTKAHIARAVLECIAYQTADLVRVMNEDAPCPLPDVIPLGAPSAGNPGAELRCALYREAAGHLRQAKEYHDLLEAGFAPFVDFSIADRAALDCCAELEVLADRAARG